MLAFLEISLILFVVSTSGNKWAKKMPPKIHNEYVIASFRSEISPMVSCLFREKWDSGVLNQGTFAIFEKSFYQEVTNWRMHILQVF